MGLKPKTANTPLKIKIETPLLKGKGRHGSAVKRQIRRLKIKRHIRG